MGHLHHTNRSLFHGPGISITAVGFFGIRRGFLSQLLLLCIGCIIVLQTTRQLLFFDVRRKSTDEPAAVSVSTVAQPAATTHLMKSELHGQPIATARSTNRESPVAARRNKLVAQVSPPDVSHNARVGNSSSPTPEARQPIPTVISMDGLEPMKAIMQRSWNGGSLFCETIRKTRGNASDDRLPITVNITFGCQELFEKAGCGTGNFLFVLYGMRMTTKVFHNVGLNFTCTDAEATKHSLILPWLMGWFPPRAPGAFNPYPMVKPQETCGLYWKVPLSRMYREIRYDLRRMAVELAGVPDRNHPSAKFVKAVRALASSGSSSWSAFLPPQSTLTTDSSIKRKSLIEIDDAVIHFRLGDLMNTNHEAYGMLSFHGYTRHISPEARSIGILTSPLDGGGQVRELDSGATIRDRSIIVLTSFVDYVQQKFPQARVRVHNDANETIAATYSRMVMANQTIVGISTFGVFPAIASFGTGYVRRPDYDIAPNKWLLYPPIDELADNVVLFDDPVRIMAPAIKKLWATRGKEGVLEWFWNDTATL